MFAQLELALIPIILNTNCVLVLYKLEPFLIDVSVNLLRFGFGFLGSLVSKDGRSDISRILMPSPLSHCRVLSQDPSS